MSFLSLAKRRVLGGGKNPGEIRKCAGPIGCEAQTFPVFVDRRPRITLNSQRRSEP